jgi:hypothetical protein
MKPVSTRFALSLSLVSLAFSALTGCYGAAPPRPATIPLPPIAEGAEIEVRTEVKTTMEDVSKEASTCPAGHAPGSPACTITRYTVSEPVTRTKSTASYAGEPISYAQLRVMTDPDREAKLANLANLSHTCTRANVPRYAGLGLVIGGLILAGIGGSKNSSAVVWSGYGAVALGGGAYALGYFSFGGRDCNEARSLYNQVDVSTQVDWHEVMGQEYASEMKTMADSFNASRSHAASAMRMR